MTDLSAFEHLMLRGFFKKVLEENKHVTSVVLQPTSGVGRESLQQGNAHINSICLILFEGEVYPHSIFCVIPRSFYKETSKIEVTGDDFVGLHSFIHGI